MFESNTSCNDNKTPISSNLTPVVTTMTKTTNKEKASDAAPRVNIQDFCEEHYKDILPIIMEKARHDKRKEVQTRLNFGENPKEARRERENSLNSRAENSPTSPYPERSRTHGPQQNPNQAGRTQETPLVGEVVRSVEGVPKGKIVSEALKNRTTTLTLRGQKPNIVNAHGMKIEAIREKDRGILNPHHPTGQEAAPVTEDTGSQRRKDASE
ncbi:hypothetical protein Tco_1073252 [Tanacetum coccineum]